MVKISLIWFCYFVTFYSTLANGFGYGSISTSGPIQNLNHPQQQPTFQQHHIQKALTSNLLNLASFGSANAGMMPIAITYVDDQSTAASAPNGVGVQPVQFASPNQQMFNGFSPAALQQQYQNNIQQNLQQMAASQMSPQQILSPSIQGPPLSAAISYSSSGPISVQPQSQIQQNPIQNVAGNSAVFQQAIQQALGGPQVGAIEQFIPSLAAQASYSVPKLTQPMPQALPQAIPQALPQMLPQALANQLQLLQQAKPQMLQQNPILDQAGSAPLTDQQLTNIFFDTPANPINLVFRTSSSPVSVQQFHQKNTGTHRLTTSVEDPHTYTHTVTKPIIQELNEIIAPVRKVKQEVLPVREEVHTMVSNNGARGVQAIPMRMPTPTLTPLMTAPVQLQMPMHFGHPHAGLIHPQAHHHRW